MVRPGAKPHSRPELDPTAGSSRTCDRVARWDGGGLPKCERIVLPPAGFARGDATQIKGPRHRRAGMVAGWNPPCRPDPGCLVRLPVPQGAASVICPTTRADAGLTWGANGDIVFAGSESGVSGLFLVRAEGGSPKRLDVPGLKNGGFLQPQFLPDGKDILFAWEADGDDQPGLYLAHIEDGKVAEAPRLLRKNPTAGQFSPAAGGIFALRPG